MKENKGITLISLVVTIIVLLILSMVSINALVGDNGILERARESKILTILSDIIFNLESNIVDINMQYIPRGIYLTAAEKLQELNKKGSISINKSSSRYEASVFSSKINDNRGLGDLQIGFNGDIWLDNYKRGKIQLSTQTQIIDIDDRNAKLTIIDGTVEEISQGIYYIHALEDRIDEFACWVNEYGEIFSQFPDNIVFMPRGYEVNKEYIAIYDKELRDEILNTEGAFIGMESRIEKDSDTLLITGQTIYPKSTYYTDYSGEKVLHYGIAPYYYGIYFSSDERDLLYNNDYDLLNFEMSYYYTNEYYGDANYYYEICPLEDKLEWYNCLFESIPSYNEIYNIKKYTSEEDKICGRYIPLIDDYKNLENNSHMSYFTCQMDIEELKSKGITRLYYRTYLYGLVCMIDLRENVSDEYRWPIFYLDDEYNPYKDDEHLLDYLTFYESTIKYIDL